MPFRETLAIGRLTPIERETMTDNNAEELLFHLANRYLRHLLPAEYQQALAERFVSADARLDEDVDAKAWSQRVMWLSHWDGVITGNVQTDAIAATVSSALLNNRQIVIHYQGKDNSFHFNPFGLVKRDHSLLLVGSYDQNTEPFVLTLRKIKAVETAETTALLPPADFDLQAFVYHQLNFVQPNAILSCLQLEFTADVYSYLNDHPLQAETIRIESPEHYHHQGYCLLEAKGVHDGERLRQWIRGFGPKAQVLKPLDLRIVMEQARLDTRTNLLTATEFKRCLKRELQRCLRDKKTSFALIILDLDHFKQINDRNGHDFGDSVLLQVANCIREYDEAARHGGEEFTILLPDTQAQEATAIAQRIRQQIEQQPLKNAEGKTVSVTASIGLAVYPDDVPAPLKAKVEQQDDVGIASQWLAESLFHTADQALYQAKALGRNRVVRANGLTEPLDAHATDN